jgi:hypothetical protein
MAVDGGDAVAAAGIAALAVAGRAAPTAGRTALCCC